MTWKARVEELIGRDLAEDLVARGFVPNSQTESFDRSLQDRVERWGLRFIDRSTESLVEVSAAIRIDSIEKVLHRTSGLPLDAVDFTSTIGAPMRLIDACSRGQYPVDTSRAELHAALREDLLRAERFFAKYATLGEIEKVLNEEPLERCLLKPMEWLRAATGVVIAQRLERENLMKLSTTYLGKMKRYSRGFYLGRFKALLCDIGIAVEG